MTAFACGLGARLKKSSKISLAKEGGGYLLYILLDEAVDGYFDALDAYEDRIEGIEELVFGEKATTQVNRSPLVSPSDRA